jgi:hypothetical protein
MKRKEQAPTFGMNRQMPMMNSVTIKKPKETSVPTVKRIRLTSKYNIRMPK